MNVLVSVIVPCYNQALYLSDCINSVINQKHIFWECFIIDDGSQDNTPEVAAKFAKQDDRIKYIHKNNGGPSSARNLGIANSKGEFILPLDADDKIHPDYIVEALKIFQKNESVSVVYSKARLFGAINKTWYLPPFKPEILAFQNVVFCSAIIRKKILQQVGCYDENLIYGNEDWELWISIIEANGKFYRIEKIYFYYRISKKSRTIDLKADEEKKLQTTKIILNKHPDFFAKAINKKIYEPLYKRIYDDLKNIFMYAFYTIFRL
jgi:glycosyltransferase involved in cell wall biosynthesis